jgi:hypothetical protein
LRVLVILVVLLVMQAVKDLLARQDCQVILVLMEKVVTVAQQILEQLALLEVLAIQVAAAVVAAVLVALEDLLVGVFIQDFLDYLEMLAVFQV